VDVGGRKGLGFVRSVCTAKPSQRAMPLQFHHRMPRSLPEAHTRNLSSGTPIPAPIFCLATPGDSVECIEFTPLSLNHIMPADRFASLCYTSSHLLFHHRILAL